MGNLIQSGAIAILAVLGSGFLFGFAPQPMLRLLVRVWPKNSERRAELLAEFRVVPYSKRWFWMFDIGWAALSDGLPLRNLERRRSRAAISAQKKANESAQAGQPDLVSGLAAQTSLIPNPFMPFLPDELADHPLATPPLRLTRLKKPKRKTSRAMSYAPSP